MRSFASLIRAAREQTCSRHGCGCHDPVVVAALARQRFAPAKSFHYTAILVDPSWRRCSQVRHSASRRGSPSPWARVSCAFRWWVYWTRPVTLVDVRTVVARTFRGARGDA